MPTYYVVVLLPQRLSCSLPGVGTYLAADPTLACPTLKDVSKCVFVLCSLFSLLSILDCMVPFPYLLRGSSPLGRQVGTAFVECISNHGKTVDQPLVAADHRPSPAPSINERSTTT